MPVQPGMHERLVECGPIVDQLVDVINTAKKAFLQQRSQLLTQLNNQQDPLCRGISSGIQKMAELVAKEPETERAPYLRVHSILTHLLIIAETTCCLEETLQKQIKEGILFSDRAIAQVSQLFDQQSEILSCLADALRHDDKDSQKKALNDCNDVAQSCIQFATDHENRLVEGLCFPQAAPFFLTILDQMQTIVHHERELTYLLDTTDK